MFVELVRGAPVAVKHHRPKVHARKDFSRGVGGRNDGRFAVVFAVSVEAVKRVLAEQRPDQKQGDQRGE